MFGNHAKTFTKYCSPTKIFQAFGNPAKDAKNEDFVFNRGHHAQTSVRNLQNLRYNPTSVPSYLVNFRIPFFLFLQINKYVISKLIFFSPGFENE
jgi:hypothetical protein